MLEFYTAYPDYEDQMNFMESLIRTLAERVLGKTVIEQNKKGNMTYQSLFRS
ncbi:MAG: hypothetical protein Ct9H300mP20_13910 [Gammaproteobacteria bacterium]|nr:MAG: hypothetical protein Ct9H300mP20_13910 [Gammaproteobacteria bacterium]